jgi:hypothetical protein
VFFALHANPAETVKDYSREEKQEAEDVSVKQEERLEVKRNIVDAITHTFKEPPS